MKALKIKVTVFTEATNGEFVNIFSEIVQALIANSMVFMSLPYTSMQLTERANAITTKTNDAEEGSRAQKDARDLERSVCTYILFRLQEAVLSRAGQEATYEQQVAIVNLSKFTPYKPAEPSGVIVPPMPKAKISNSSGTIALDWKANKYVKSWIIEHVAGTDVSPTADWKMIAAVGVSKFVATGLPTGYHSFRLVAVSANGESEPSEGVTEYAR